MSNRILFALTLSFALASVAWAADERTQEAVQVAQASLAPLPPGTGTQAAPQRYSTQRGVREAAEKGPGALRLYIFRTRNIYGYSFEDYAKAEWDR